MDGIMRVKKKKKFRFWKAVRKAIISAGAVAVASSTAFGAVGGEDAARNAIAVGGLSGVMFIVRFVENFTNVYRSNGKL